MNNDLSIGELVSNVYKSIGDKQQKHKNKLRDNNLMRKYKLTRDEYNKMYDNQNSCCAICGVHRSVLLVDHNHISGQVRLLLCIKCNAGLGQFNDSIDLLNKAIQYLKDNPN